MADTKPIFYTKNNKMYWAGQEMSPESMQSYIKRQELAIQKNLKSAASMPPELKAMALKANDLITPELEQAKNLYHTFTGVPRQEELDAIMGDK